MLSVLYIFIASVPILSYTKKMINFINKDEINLLKLNTYNGEYECRIAILKAN